MWRITKDFLYMADSNPNPIVDSMAGIQKGAGFKPEKARIRFRLFDDDGILYYEGIAYDEDAVEDAFFYWQADSGVTYSEIHRNRVGQIGVWEPFIG